MTTMRKGDEAFGSQAGESANAPHGISRRALLKGTATAALAAAGAGLAGAVGARAQVTGISPGGGTVPFRQPLGSLSYLDQKQYISNMEVVSYLPGATISSGEPLMALWARGRQRLLPCNGGWVDISEPKKPVVVPTSKRAGGCIAFNTRLKKWIAMSSAQAPLFGSGSPEHPLGKYDPESMKIYDSFKGLRGIRTWDITDPANPNLLQEYSTGAKGMGTHMNFYDGGKYAYLECGWDESLRMEMSGRPYSNGLMIVDLTDPADVKEVSRWWVPGQRFGEEEEYKNYPFANDQSSWTSCHGSMTVPKRPEDGGTVGYTGFGAFGMFVMDLTDITRPKPLSQLRYQYETIGGVPFHTIYPVIADASRPRLQNLVLGIPETINADCREPVKIPYVIDVKDPRNPRIIGFFPRPRAPKDAPYPDFCMARGRFGTHNCQCWIAPGTSRPEFFAVAWFVAGVRTFDLTDPTSPRETAWFVPPRDGDINKYDSWWRGTSEGAFVEWDRNLIWLGTHAGTYCLSSPALGKPVLEPRRIEKWTVAHANLGWDDQTPKTFSFGRSIRQLSQEV